MAKIFRCDRCGKDFKLPTDVRILTIPKNNAVDFDIELCTNCIENVTYYAKNNHVVYYDKDELELLRKARIELNELKEKPPQGLD